MADDLTTRRRAAPLEFFREILKAVWMDNTPEEALALWKTRAAAGGTFARDALECLDHITTNPPPDLIVLMQENGWLYLTHEDETPLDFDEHVAWLRAEIERLRSALA